MTADPDRVRRRAVRGIVFCCLLLVWCPRAFALNPALDVSQYAHTAWKVRDGFSKGTIDAIAQTPDGYLWLGTEFGLLRFDGVRAVSWQPTQGETLPSNWIRALLVGRDGTLWIGTLKGLASLKNGKLTQYPRITGMSVDALLEDRQGTLWAGGFDVPNGKLCAIERRTSAVQCHGDDGSFGVYVGALFEDSGGRLWIGAANGLWQWTPGPSLVYRVPDPMRMPDALVEDDDHSVIVASGVGLRKLVDGKLEEYQVPGGRRFRPSRVLRDRSGGLWIGTYTGLVHVHQGVTDVFAQSDGLSGDVVGPLFEDREGNIWVTTADGLDRFREFAVATISVKQGLPPKGIVSVLAATGGGVWIGTLDGLNRRKDGKSDVYRDVRFITSLFQDDGGPLWVATYRGVGYFENGGFVSISGVPGGLVRSIAVDREGDLWLANQTVGLLRVHRGRTLDPTSWSTLGHKDFATAAVADRVRGGLWLGFYHGGVVYFADHQVRARYAAADGLGDGLVNQFRFDSDGTLWAATEGGLSRFHDGRVVTLATRNGLPCDTVHWLMEDDSRSLWMFTPCGLVRIARSELATWIADPKRTIRPTVFDSSDGVRLRSSPVTTFKPQVTKSSDGKLWFLSGDGVSVVDPQNLPFNRLSPPVHIEQITADRKIYDVTFAGANEVRLPPLVRDLQIDYTALSLVAPEKMRFRYKLEGWDRDWQDVGTRRQAFYNNLPPRSYRFRVTASNNSGVWNEVGAFRDFAVAPAYYQTTWFRVSVVALVFASFAALYRLRRRRAARQFNMTLEARVSERTRIARELHDTLLQSFHGLLLRFQAVAYLLSEGTEARNKLESAIDQAAEAITEGRNAVQGLRTSTIVTNDLAPALRTLGDELAGDQRSPNGTSFSVEVEGTPRDLHPIMRDEIYRVAGEAMRNAFRHAHATRIEVEIRYDDRQLRVRVRDDGKGIDAHVLDGGGRAGHYGLAGMYERAALIGGKLTAWSELESGTEVELTIPASVAYANSPAAAQLIDSSTGM